MAGGPTVGLDIGTNLIKAVEIRRGNNGPQVVALGVAATPQEAYENNVIVDPQMLGQAVKDLLKQSGISSRQVISSVSGQSVVVRVIDVPKMNATELADAMKWEVERHVPFAVSEVIVDYQAIERAEEGDGQNMEVLLAVAQQDMIDRHVDMLRAAGLKPVYIDVEPLAASRCLLDLAPNAAPGHTVAIINIGASNTDISIFRDKLLAFPRTLPLAGENFTRAIADTLGVDMTTAENYKREFGEVMLDQMQAPAPAFAPEPTFGGGGGGFMDFSAPPPPPTAPSSTPSGRMPFDFSAPGDAPEPTATDASPFGVPPAGNPFGGGPDLTAPGEPANPFLPGGAPPVPPPTNLPATVGDGDPNQNLRVQVFNAMAPVLQDLVSELRRSLDYYRGRAADAQIHEMLLIGGSAKIRNLAQFLQSELGIPTRVADPLQTVQVTSKNFSQSHLEEVASLFPVSIGLGARDFIAVPGGGKKR